MSMAGGMFLTSQIIRTLWDLVGMYMGTKANDQLPLLMQSPLAYLDSSPLPKLEGGIKRCLEMSCLEL